MVDYYGLLRRRFGCFGLCSEAGLGDHVVGADRPLQRGLTREVKWGGFERYTALNCRRHIKSVMRRFSAGLRYRQRSTMLGDRNQ
jgi:hypothetical protein